MEEHHPEGFREFGMDPDLYNEELLEEQQLHQLCFCKFGMDPDVYKAQVINKVIQDLRGLDPDATENTLNHVRTTIETVQTFSEDFFLVPKAVVLLHRFINGLSIQQMTLNVWFKNMTVAETAKKQSGAIWAAKPPLHSIREISVGDGRARLVAPPRSCSVVV